MKFIEPIDVPDGWRYFPHHPLSALTEFGQAIDLDGLTGHMKRNGYDEDEPIILIDVEGSWQIFDGRHRQHAAWKAEVTPTFAKFIGPDPLEYVKKKAFRQHLAKAKRAMLAAMTVTSIAGANQHAKGKTVAEAAADYDVSPRHVHRAKAIIEGGTKTLCDAVTDEKVSLSDAAEIAHMPAKIQNAAVKALEAKQVDCLADFVWPICERCRQLDEPIEDCKACAAKHEMVKEGRIPKLPPSHYVDDDDQVVPDRLRQVFACVKTFKEAAKKLNECGRLFQEIENSPARDAKPIDPEYKHYQKFYSVFKNARWRCTNMRPALLCQACGQDGCDKCAGKGWLTVEEAKKCGRTSSP